jgi:hypothetical protein
MKTILLSALMVAATAAQSPGQGGAVTEPVGYTTIQLPGASGGGTVETPFTWPLTSAVISEGPVTAIEGDTVSLQQPSGPGELLYLTVQTGPFAGLALNILSWQTSQILTIESPPPGAIVPGTNVRVRSRATLNSAFPPDRLLELDWRAGPTPDTTDNIVLWKGSTQTPSVFFISPAGPSGPAKWRLADQRGDAGNTPLTYPTALLAVRRSPQQIDLINVGHVNVLNRRWQQVWPGLNLLGTPFGTKDSPAGTLANCGLYNPGSPYSIIAGLNPAEADTVTFYNETTRMPSAWCSLGSNPASWLGTGTNAFLSNTQLPFNGPLLLYRYGPPTWVTLNYPPLWDYPGPAAAARLTRSVKPAIKPAVAAAEVPITILPASKNTVTLRWPSKRGSYYTIETNEGTGWRKLSRYRATGPHLTIRRPIAGRAIFRVLNQ